MRKNQVRKKNLPNNQEVFKFSCCANHKAMKRTAIRFNYVANGCVQPLERRRQLNGTVGSMAKKRFLGALRANLMLLNKR